MTIHAQLRAAYLASGRTIEDIGRDAGVSKNTAIRALGPTARNVSAETLIALAMVLGLTRLDVPRRERDGLAQHMALKQRR